MAVCATGKRIHDRADALNAQSHVARGHVTDLSDAATWLVGEVLTEFGHIDVSVNYAGMTSAGNLEPFTPMAEIDDASWHADIARYLTTCYLVTRRVLPGLLARRAGASSTCRR